MFNRPWQRMVNCNFHKITNALRLPSDNELKVKGIGFYIAGPKDNASYKMYSMDNHCPAPQHHHKTTSP